MSGFHAYCLIFGAGTAVQTVCDSEDFDSGLRECMGAILLSRERKGWRRDLTGCPLMLAIFAHRSRGSKSGRAIMPGRGPATSPRLPPFLDSWPQMMSRLGFEEEPLPINAIAPQSSATLVAGNAYIIGVSLQGAPRRMPSWALGTIVAQLKDHDTFSIFRRLILWGKSLPGPDALRRVMASGMCLWQGGSGRLMGKRST